MNSKKMIYYSFDDFLRGKQNFAVEKKEFSANTEYSFHWHDYFELEFVLDGLVEHRLNDSTEIIGSGSAYLLSLFDSHSFKALTPIEIFSVKFNEALLPSELIAFLLIRGGGFKCCFNEEEMSYIRQRADRILQEKESYEFYSFMVTALITEIVLLMVRKSGVSSIDAVPTLVQKVQRYAVVHFREKLSLKIIANELSVTPKYLGSVFKESTNMFFGDYLNNIRMRYACNLLLTSDLTVKEICFSSGYSSVEYFLDVFKGKYNTTPTRYRKNYKSTGAAKNG